MKIKQLIKSEGLITGKDLDLDSYESKFLWWDENKHRMKTGDKDVLLALTDLTVYAYAFFKDKKGKPLRLEPYQDAIAQVIMSYDFKHDNINRFSLFRAANQIGKSMLLCMFAIYNLFNGTNETIVIVSNNLTNSQRVLREIKFILNTSTFSGWKEDIGDSDNTTMLSIERKSDNVNRIICAPSGEGLLGHPVARLLLDELDFYEEAKNFFWKVAYPRLGQTKGQVIGFSNPNPDIALSNSILHELEHGDIFKRKFHFNFLDASWNSVEEYEVAKRNSPSHLFTSTHDGEYSDLSGSFLNKAQIDDMMMKEWVNVLRPVGRKAYIAVDLGKMRDNTVITVGFPIEPKNQLDKYFDLEVRYTEKLPLKTDYDKIADRIAQIRDFYNENDVGVAVIAFDATGQKTFGDFLKRMGISAVGVDFSSKVSNKTLLYNNLLLMAENRKIKVVYTSDCEMQLSKLEVKETASKKLQVVEHKTEGDHDDYPDSLAILIHVSVRPSNIPVTVRRVEQEVKEKVDPFSNYEDRVKDFRAKELKANRDKYYKNKQRFSVYGGM